MPIWAYFLITAAVLAFAMFPAAPKHRQRPQNGVILPAPQSRTRV